MSIPPTVSSSGETPASDSTIGHLIGVLVSPNETFAMIVRRPTFFAPLVAAILAAVAFTETMLAKIGMVQIIRTSLEQSGRAERMSAEQLEQAIERGAAIGSIVSHVMAVLGTPVFLLIVAAIGLVVLNSIFGARSEFKTIFSVACYAYLPAVIGAIMGIALIFLGDVERFNPQNPIPSNIGFFLNQAETSKPLYVLVSSLDIFTIWFLILLGIGLATASERKAKGLSVFMIYCGLWLVWVLGKVGLATL